MPSLNATRCPKRILDASALIQHWGDCGGRSPEGKTSAAVEQWAQQLIDAQDTDAIVTPVYIEFIAGVTNKVEMELSRAFLGKFRIIDEERIIPEDWQEAR